MRGILNRKWQVVRALVPQFSQAEGRFGEPFLLYRRVNVSLPPTLLFPVLVYVVRVKTDQWLEFLQEIDWEIEGWAQGIPSQ